MHRLLRSRGRLGTIRLYENRPALGERAAIGVIYAEAACVLAIEQTARDDSGLAHDGCRTGAGGLGSGAAGRVDSGDAYRFVAGDCVGERAESGDRVAARRADAAHGAASNPVGDALAVGKLADRGRVGCAGRADTGSVGERGGRVAGHNLDSDVCVRLHAAQAADALQHSNRRNPRRDSADGGLGCSARQFLAGGVAAVRVAVCVAVPAFLGDCVALSGRLRACGVPHAALP
jgi:hypothetical protein